MLLLRWRLYGQQWLFAREAIWTTRHLVVCPICPVENKRKGNYLNNWCRRHWIKKTAKKACSGELLVLRWRLFGQWWLFAREAIWTTRHLVFCPICPVENKQRKSAQVKCFYTDSQISYINSPDKLYGQWCIWCPSNLYLFQTRKKKTTLIFWLFMEATDEEQDKESLLRWNAFIEVKAIRTAVVFAKESLHIWTMILHLFQPWKKENYLNILVIYGGTG